MNARFHLMASVMLALTAWGCGAADPGGADEPASESQALAGGAVAQRKGAPGVVAGPLGPFEALQWKRSEDRGMTCAELAACCPKLPQGTQASCQQIVEQGDETLCSVITSPFCAP